MRMIISAFLLTITAACGSAEPSPAAVPAAPAADPSAPADTEPTAEPAASGGIPCTQEIARECGDGLADGCLLPHPTRANQPLTTAHICVRASDAESDGIPCDNEISYECEEAGLIDACDLVPPASDVHLCVER